MFTHFVKFSNTVMAKSACHCKATSDHFAGEERGLLPRGFYASLRRAS